MDITTTKWVIGHRFVSTDLGRCLLELTLTLLVSNGEFVCKSPMYGAPIFQYNKQIKNDFASGHFFEDFTY